MLGICRRTWRREFATLPHQKDNTSINFVCGNVPGERAAFAVIVTAGSEKTAIGENADIDANFI